MASAVLRVGRRPHRGVAQGGAGLRPRRREVEPRPLRLPDRRVERAGHERGHDPRRGLPNPWGVLALPALGARGAHRRGAREHPQDLSGDRVRPHQCARPCRRRAQAQDAEGRDGVEQEHGRPAGARGRRLRRRGLRPEDREGCCLHRTRRPAQACQPPRAGVDREGRNGDREAPTGGWAPPAHGGRGCDHGA